MTEPFRRCVGCGRRAPRRRLVRFVAVEGDLVPGDAAPGRGVYTCRRLACFRRAAASRGFARTLRRPVRVDAALEGIYTGDLHG
jgi:predicted RNA-binding protein YlxR (DUF448 family)